MLHHGLPCECFTFVAQHLENVHHRVRFAASSKRASELIDNDPLTWRIIRFEHESRFTARIDAEALVQLLASRARFAVILCLRALPRTTLRVLPTILPFCTALCELDLGRLCHSSAENIVDSLEQVLTTNSSHPLHQGIVQVETMGQRDPFTEIRRRLPRGRRDGRTLYKAIFDTAGQAPRHLAVSPELERKWVAAMVATPMVGIGLWNKATRTAASYATTGRDLTNDEICQALEPMLDEDVRSEVSAKRELLKLQAAISHGQAAAHAPRPTKDQATARTKGHTKRKLTSYQCGRLELC